MLKSATVSHCSSHRDGKFYSRSDSLKQCIREIFPLYSSEVPGSQHHCKHAHRKWQPYSPHHCKHAHRKWQPYSPHHCKHAHRKWQPYSPHHCKRVHRKWQPYSPHHCKHAHRKWQPYSPHHCKNVHRKWQPYSPHHCKHAHRKWQPYSPHHCKRVHRKWQPYSPHHSTPLQARPQEVAAIQPTPLQARPQEVAAIQPTPLQARPQEMAAKFYIDSSGSDTEEVLLASPVRSSSPTLDRELPAILKEFCEDNLDFNSNLTVIARRKNIFKSACVALSRGFFEWHKTPNIKFVGEMGEDYGGPRRAFFRLLMIELQSNLGIFEGKPGQLLFSYNQKALEENKFYTAGRLMAWSIIHNGQGMRCLNKELFMLMCGQKPDLSTFDELISWKMKL
ncbi:uncharacterized protein LOC124380795 [Silurus meridionalis]|uniref:uncharacterized protein LOC124380795 n=1 Tax=Silurus meridionalis TaxID=175797 RepID=UPI001EEB281B|nr:uncharacterized protein LOC124380795 [Silurus meridionalis]